MKSPLAFPTRSPEATRSDWADAMERSRAINAIPSAYARPNGKRAGTQARAYWYDQPEASK